MFEELGVLIREAREAAGLDQTQIAASLGVGQQAVSGWERGKSRPRRAMLTDLSKLIHVEEHVLVDVGVYARSSSARTRAPLAPTLPLGSMPPDRFESLTADVLQLLFPAGHASRFGGQGEKQFGIDVLVAADDGHNLATGQCKRHQQFGEAMVAKAIAVVSIAADKHYLFLSRTTASPGARLEVGKHKGWELWDGEDIARYIHQLPLDTATRLINVYFPSEHESFLGVPTPGPWFEPEDYFLEGTNEFNRSEWALTGRDSELQQLSSLVYRDARSLALMVGRGGTGKTRLLRALAEAAPNAATAIKALPGSVKVDPAAFELLPNQGKLIVLLDDVHERPGDLRSVLAGIWRRNRDASVVLVTRPYYWAIVKGDLQGISLAPGDPLTIELAELKLLDAEDLARQVLGEGVIDAVVHRLARLTRDCPLVTVVGGILIREGRLDLNDLEHDGDVRTAVLRGYRQALVADPQVGDPDTRNAVLDTVAALQPFRTDDAAFQTILAAVVGKPYDVLLRHLRTLEEGGLLRRRGASLRVAPDLLGDVVLADVSWDDLAQQPTGFLERVRESADGLVLQHLLVNVSRIDWQIKRGGAVGAPLLDGLWDTLVTELRSAGIAGRKQLVKLISRIAYFQPERIVPIALWLINHPTDEVGSDEPTWYSVPTYQDVLHQLPAMLKPAAYTLDTLPAVLRVLWQLAQTDQRPTNQHPNHALRVLSELAQYEVGKPLFYNEAVLDEVATWLDQDNILSPFKVLEPLLETEITRETYQDYTLTFQPFAIAVDAVLPIRERAIGLALDRIDTADPRFAVAAVNFIGASLNYPHGMFDRTVGDDERAAWTPSFIRTIEQLGAAIVNLQPDPATLVAVRAALHWHDSFSSSPTRHAAEAVTNALRDDLPDRVALIIHDGWGHLVRQRDEDYAKSYNRRQYQLVATATELSKLPGAGAVELLKQRLEGEQRGFGQSKGNAGPLLGELIKIRPELADTIIDLVIGDSSCLFAPLLPIVLAVSAELDADAAVARLRSLVALDQPAITRSVAQSAGWNRGARPLADGERELLLDFARSPDPVIRQAPITVAERVATEQPMLAAELIMATDFSNDARLTEEVFMAFTEPFGLRWEHLAPAQRILLRERIIMVDDLDSHWLIQFLAERSAADPAWVITLLQERVRHGEQLESLGGYRPMPFQWSQQLRAREHDDFIRHLKQLHAWIAEAPTSWLRREMGAEIFQVVAGPFDQTVLAILLEAVQSDNINDITGVGAILRKAKRTFIWDEPEFVIAALNSAQRFGNECRQDLESALWGATISGVRSGTPGQPFGEDVEQRDRSLAVANTLRPGSHEAEFYRGMARNAEDSITRSVERDQADDGRDW